MKKLLTAILVGFQVIAAPLLVIAQTSGATGNVAVLYFAPPGEGSTTGTVALDGDGNFSVDVKINTHGANSAGADVIVTFDNSQIQYVGGSMAGIGSGNFYPTQVKGAPTTTAGISAANTNERISMARTILSPEEGSTPDYTNGNGVFATLKFKPVASSPVGTTVGLGFDYQAGATSDSNVTGATTSAPDILATANDVTLTIQAGTTSGTMSSVSLTPETATIVPYGTKTLTAAALDASGNTISSGVTYAWTVSGNGVLSATTGSSVTFTSNQASSGSATVTVTATQNSITKTDNSTITISSVATDSPNIDRIVPGQGYENEDVEIEIYGTNFDSDNGRVYIGTRLADIVSWGDTKIVVLVPQVSVSKDTEYQVKVRRSDGEEATYMGYTYLDKTGLPLLPWLVMFPLNGAAAMLAKKKLFRKK